MEVKPQPCTNNWRNIIPPEGIIKYKQMIDGWYRTWQEYVPSCYDGSVPVPLVITVAGAAHHNADKYTAWPMIAERENFIVLYPHCLIEGIKYNLWRDYDGDGDMPDDIAYFDALIEMMKEKYNIDDERIYMQGQSNGDMMTSTYIFERGYKLAAAAPLNGPAGAYRFVSPETGEIIRAPEYELPIIRCHGSEDVGGPMGKRSGKTSVIVPEVERHITEEERANKFRAHQMIHLYLWRETNRCTSLPKLSMRGRYSWLHYEGDPCDLIYYIVEKGEHGPYHDMADYIWTYFFSGYKRVNGKIIRTEPNDKVEPDQGTIALADGASKAYIDNKLVDMDEEGRKTRLIDGVYYVPVRFLEKAFQVTVEMYHDEEAAVISWGPNQLQLAMGNRAVVLNNRLRDINRTLYFDNSLYVPISDLAELMFGLKSAAGRGACYISQHGGEMSFDFAYIIRELLGTEKIYTPLDCYNLEVSLIKELDLEQDEARFREYMKRYKAENGIDL
ncbi:stalk domain-containing protein [Neobacillus sp. 3P2-tot-E-2]|uniref:stalk domain-containing protein n=1 Tax=Neobacillus sp. 3P2-tot-E-2 TaxID=3132212 RepID=UPI0039A2DA0F